MTISTKTVIEARWTLQEIEDIIIWARMKIKPSKSRSLVLKKGKIKNETFKTADETIPTVSEKPVKCLGKCFDDSLSDIGNVNNTQRQLEKWMDTIDRSGLPGKYKTWIYQHGVLPRVLWPLLVYDVPMTTVESMERLASRYLMRWLSVPRSFSSIGLYSSGSKLQLPLTSLKEEFKVTKVRQLLMLRDSRDAKVREARVNIRTGRKWSAKKTMEEAESQLQHGDIVGTVALGRQGLGVTTGKKWRTSNQEERRHLVQKEVRAMEEQSRMVRATGMKKQGNWLNWEGARQKKLSWNDIWCMEPQRLQFQLKSVYDVLPTPSNLATWGMTDDPACKLCGRPTNLEHILSSCSVALADGRYTWRHDKVLSVLADTLENIRKRSKRDKGGLKFINFVKAGEQSVKGSVEGSGVLGTAEDWQLRADLNGRMTFPPEIAVTNQRPDIVIWSSSSKQAVLVELTMPWEDRINDAYVRKQAKYQDLVSDCQQRGWRMWCLPVEVSCRGFVGQSMWRALRIIGITGIERRRLIGRLCREAEVASMWLWKKREEQWRGQHQ